MIGVHRCLRHNQLTVGQLWRVHVSVRVVAALSLNGVAELISYEVSEEADPPSGGNLELITRPRSSIKIPLMWRWPELTGSMVGFETRHNLIWCQCLF